MQHLVALSGLPVERHHSAITNQQPQVAKTDTRPPLKRKNPQDTLVCHGRLWRVLLWHHLEFFSAHCDPCHAVKRSELHNVNIELSSPSTQEALQRRTPSRQFSAVLPQEPVQAALVHGRLCIRWSLIWLASVCSSVSTSRTHNRRQRHFDPVLRAGQGRPHNQRAGPGANVEITNRGCCYKQTKAGVQPQAPSHTRLTAAQMCGSRRMPAARARESSPQHTPSPGTVGPH